MNREEMETMSYNYFDVQYKFMLEKFNSLFVRSAMIALRVFFFMLLTVLPLQNPGGTVGNITA